MYHINAGVPQVIAFGPVGYIVHINDLQTRSPLYKYVDDSTEARQVCSSSAVDKQIQQTATEAVVWEDNNLMCVNCDKTKKLLVFWGVSLPISQLKQPKIYQVAGCDNKQWLSVSKHLAMIVRILITCHLTLGICLPSVAHALLGFRFWQTGRDSEEGDEDRIPRAILRMPPRSPVPASIP